MQSKKVNKRSINWGGKHKFAFLDNMILSYYSKVIESKINIQK